MSAWLAAGNDEQDAPILVELRLRWEATEDPVERASLRMRQGLYLARTNRLAEAEALPEQIRADWAGREELRVHIWLWILEGVLQFYRTSRTEGRQRLLQAHAAALKAGSRAEAEIAAAWLAHFAYVDNDYAAMGRWLLASSLGTAALPESVARSSLTLACALQLFGEEPLAAKWFARAREIARTTGDRAGIMAATANRLMLKLNDNWLDHVFSVTLRHPAEPLRQELLGILGYERLSGSESLGEQNEIAQLRLAVLQGEDESALTLARAMSAARERRSVPSLKMAQVIEHALLVRQAPLPEAQSLVQGMADAFDAQGLDDDDAAGCWALLSQAAASAGALEEGERLLALANGARRRFETPLRDQRPDLLSLEREADARWAGS